MNETLLDISRQFWEAMEHADEVGMRACAHPDCNFVHIGITCKLDKEIEFYTSGAFQPPNITFHSQKAELFGDTGVVLTDCDYSLLLDGKETTHHFMALSKQKNLTSYYWILNCPMRAAFLSALKSAAFLMFRLFL